MRALLFDLRQVLRGLVRAPGFSLLAIAGVAIGVAASTAMFTVVDTILWRPLPYPAPERQVILRSVDAHGARVPLGSEFFALQAMAKTVESIGVMMPYDATVDARELRAAKVSASLFATLGIVPAQGRAFEPAEDREGGPAVAIVADSYWRNELRADPHALGRTLDVDHRTVTIVGILPKSAALPYRDTTTPALLFPLAVDRLRRAHCLRSTGSVGLCIDANPHPE